MKKNIIFTLMLAACGLTFVSCSEDDLSSESIITADKVEKTPLDYWLDANFVEPFNIAVKYRYEYNETNNSYYTVPARYDDAVLMAHILKYCCVDAYVDVAGLDFTRRYFPKLFYLEGEWHYRNNGTFELGTAEGGRKIFLMGLNYLSGYYSDVETLNYYYMKTIHHEFTHILHQTVEFSAAYQLITPDNKTDKWSNPEFKDYLVRGFISDYAQSNYHEDFAEMVSIYVTKSAEEWEALLAEAAGTAKDPKPGRDLIEQKLNIMRAYMSDQWGIDIDKLRATILQREADVANGKVNLTDLTVK